MNCIKYYILLSVLFFHQLLLAQNPQWVNYTGGETIYALAEEGESMWVGTIGGLVKVDRSTGKTSFYNLFQKGALLNQINCIAIDSSGNKWLGTDNLGLVKFDGENVSIYNMKNGALPSNEITCITIDKSGNLWLGSDSHISKFNGISATSYKMGMYAKVYDIGIDSNEVLWVGTSEGLAKFDGLDFSFYHPTDLYTDEVASVEFDSAGVLWIGCKIESNTIQGGIVSYDGNTFKKYSVGSNQITDIFIDNKGKIWAGGGENYYSFNGSFFNSYKVEYQVNTLWFDEDNIGWIGTRLGLFRVKDNYVTHINTSNSKIGNLHASEVLDVAFDNKGTTWLSSYNSYYQMGGLVKINENNWESYTSSNSRYFGTARCIFTDSANNLWYGTDNFVYKFDGNYWTSYHQMVDAGFYKSVTCLAMDESGNVWAGTPMSGIFKFDGNSWKSFTTNNSGIPGDGIYSIAVDKNNHVWVSTTYGLAEYNGATWKKHGTKIYNEIAIDKDNNLWMSYAGQLVKYDRTSFIYYSPDNIPPNIAAMEAVAVDSMGDKWVGIIGSGLYKFDGSVWTAYTPANSGLPTTHIYHIKIDGHNNKWLATTNGLAIFNEDGVDLLPDTTDISYLPEIHSPKVGDTLSSCETVSISCLSKNSLRVYGSGKLEYTIDGGKSWRPIAYNTSYSSPSNPYSWKVPAVNSNKCLIRVTDSKDPNLQIKSIGYFAIKHSGSKSIQLTGPVTPDTLSTGQNILLTWVSSGAVANVKIEYVTEAGKKWNLVAHNHPNTGSYTFTIPGDASDYSIRISDAVDECVQDYVSFSVKAVPFITITQPNTNTKIPARSNYLINWTSGGVLSGFVKIDYSKDGGASWEMVAEKEANDGSYVWVVPNINSTNCFVRISDWADEYLKDISNEAFTITIPTITILTPAQGEFLNACANYTITWKSNAASNSFRLYYSVDNGITWHYIKNASSFTESHSTTWLVPGGVSGPCLLKITSFSNENIYAISSPFNLVNNATVTLTFPNGGETLIAGNTYSISWIKTGTSTWVKLFYSVDRGVSWNAINSFTTTSDLSYSWTIPGMVSSDVLIKVQDYNNSCLSDFSDSLFAIGSSKVWPGDADNNGTVNLKDLLPIGLHYGATGSARDSVSIVWAGQSSSDWNIKQANGNDIKYVDCNGDGSINDVDTVAVKNNFGRNQTTSGLRINQVAGDTDVSLYLNYSKSSYYPGDTVSVELLVGSQDKPLLDFYGIAFSIAFQRSAIQPNTFVIDYDNSWVGDLSETLTLTKVQEDNNLAHGVIVRKTMTGSDGYGKVADIQFVINESFMEKGFGFGVADYKAIKSTGANINFLTGMDTVKVEPILTSLDMNTVTFVSFYPNPVKSTLYIKNVWKEKDVQIEMQNQLGETFIPELVTISEEVIEVPVNGLLPGVYMIKVVFKDRYFIEKIVVE